ncbi:MAG TPA: hypothetical protein VNM72_14950 [Blastocatellia bacterium]|nr:hypothetical protein [Blastocatellia bacterium]
MKASVLVAVTDLFFLARIQRVAEELGLTVVPVRNVADLLTCARSERPAAIIFDLMDRRIDAEAALDAIKADDQLKGIPTVGFFAHVHTEVKDRARRAGCDRVLPRSVFIPQLPHLLIEIITSAAEGRER